MRRWRGYPSPSGMSIPWLVCSQIGYSGLICPQNPHAGFLTRVFAISTLFRGSRPSKSEKQASKTENEAQKRAEQGSKPKSSLKNGIFRQKVTSGRDCGRRMGEGGGNKGLVWEIEWRPRQPATASLLLDHRSSFQCSQGPHCGYPSAWHIRWSGQASMVRSGACWCILSPWQP